MPEYASSYPDVNKKPFTITDRKFIKLKIIDMSYL